MKKENKIVILKFIDSQDKVEFEKWVKTKLTKEEFDKAFRNKTISNPDWNYEEIFVQLEEKGLIEEPLNLKIETYNLYNY